MLSRFAILPIRLRVSKFYGLVTTKSIARSQRLSRKFVVLFIYVGCEAS